MPDIGFLKNTYSDVFPDHRIVGVDVHPGNVVLHFVDGDGHKGFRKFCFVEVR